MDSTDGTDLDYTTTDGTDTYPADGTTDDTTTSTGTWTTDDLDGDGRLDTAYQVLGTTGWEAVVDSDGDTVADTYMVDADGDGVAEATVVRDGDTYVISVDTDGDGVPDTETTLTRDEVAAQVPELVELLDVRFGDGAEVTEETTTDEWVQDGQLVGDPTGDSEHWFEQGFNGSCVPASVTQIVAEYTGEDPGNENEFIQMANDLGLWIVGPDGVPGIGIEGAAQMLQQAGIPAELEYSSTDELAQYLDDGRGVICYIDSGEIWYGDEDVEDNTIDHAVVVTGIDVERGVVIVSDTGDPDGNMAEYPLDQFEDAWADGGNAVVVCDQPPADEATDAPVQDAADSGDQSPVQKPGPDDAADEPAGAGLSLGTVLDNPWVLVPVYLQGALRA